MGNGQYNTMGKVKFWTGLDFGLIYELGLDFSQVKILVLAKLDLTQ